MHELMNKLHGRCPSCKRRLDLSEAQVKVCIYQRSKFKIAKELARKGYVIKDIEDFDNQLKSLLERKPKNQGVV
jgi:molybdenum cofactor biosynthesis enzyme MoaA